MRIDMLLIFSAFIIWLVSTVGDNKYKYQEVATEWCPALIASDKDSVTLICLTVSSSS